MSFKRDGLRKPTWWLRVSDKYADTLRRSAARTLRANRERVEVDALLLQRIVKDWETMKKKLAETHDIKPFYQNYWNEL